MSEQPLLSDLVARWQQLRQQGQTPSAEELCAACPERLEELKRHLRELASGQPPLPSSQEGVVTSTSSQVGLNDPTVTQTFPTGQPPAAGTPAGPVAGYEVVGELGRGGMGVVYKARQLNLKRLVALKMVLSGSHASPDQLTRFRVEAEAVARLQHPNIVQIHQVGEHAGLPFFSMEYVEGGSLAGRLKQGPLPQQEAARLVETLARAVQHAHQRGVVHRDLKPANILLTEEGSPKITDFGLAKQLEDDAGAQTRSGAVMGTPNYMAPEQAAGKTALLGPLVDVYALGALLYECLTGRPPFRGATMMDTLHQVIHEEATPPSRHQPKLDRDLETICLKALAKDPAKRYASGLALAQDLERYLAGEPILARRAGMLSRLWRRARRRPVATLSLPVLLLAVVAVVLVSRQVGTTQRKADLARQFDEGLQAAAWTAERGEQLERLLGEWEALDPAQAAAARRRLLDRFAALFRGVVRQPRLGAEHIAGLEADLQWVADRDAALAQTLGQELRDRVRAWQPRFNLAAPWKELTEVFVAGLVQPKGDALLPAGHADPKPARVLTRVSSQGPVQLEASFDDSWRDSSGLGLLVGAGAEGGRGQGYSFLLTTADQGPAPAVRDGGGPVQKPTARSFRQFGGSAQMQILRNGVVLRRQAVVVAPGSLQLAVRREGDRLQFQVNGGEPLVFFDTVPLRSTPAQVFGLEWPAGVGLTQLRGTTQTLPEKPSPLERGDQFYEEGHYAQALALYREQAIAAGQEAGREARGKAALCLLSLNRLDEAAALFEALAAEGEGRWPLLAMCQLWLIRLEQGRPEETAALFLSIRGRFRPDELASYVPETLKQRVLSRGALSHTELLFPTAKLLPRVEEAVHLADLLGDDLARWGARYDLSHAYGFLGDEARAIPPAREALRLSLPCARFHPGAVGFPSWVGRWYIWLLRRQGQARQALGELQSYVDEFADLLRKLHPDDPKAQLNWAPLQLEQARLHVALNDWGQAEKLVDGFLRLTPDPIANYNNYGDAWLMKGFFHERRGALDEARRAWKEGLYSSYLRKFPEATRPREPVPPGMEGLVAHNIMASLTDELSDADAAALWDRVTPVLASNPSASAMATMMRPSPAVLRAMWRTPRGRDCARQMAFLTVSPAEYRRMPLLTGAAEKFRQDALGGQTTPEQDEVVWQATRISLDRFAEGKLQWSQLVQLGLAWKGTSSGLGWAGVAPKLEPALRGPLAYILGHRYLRLPGERRQDALMFFRTALQDAPADSALRRLAQQEIARLEAK